MPSSRAMPALSLRRRVRAKLPDGRSPGTAGRSDVLVEALLDGVAGQLCTVRCDTASRSVALATLGGYLLSIWIGLFGFKEVRTTAGIVAGVLEVLAFAVLAALVLAPGLPGQITAPIARTAELTAGVLGVAAVVLLGVAVGNAAQPAPAAAGTDTVLKTGTIDGVTVVTDGKGFTLYSFAPDTPTTSKCYGTCAAYWPPVLGSSTAGSGLPGKTGTIKRTDGSTQLTYDGHPLYTYIGDTAPGQASGNKLNLNGGLWLEVSASGSS